MTIVWIGLDSWGFRDVDGSSIRSNFGDRQQQFLDFVLSHYEREGVEELDPDKLKPLLRLKYHTITTPWPIWATPTPSARRSQAFSDICTTHDGQREHAKGPLRSLSPSLGLLKEPFVV